MPAQKAKSSVLSKIPKGKLGAAHKTHKDDDVNMGNMKLPPGIRGGVAQLVECKFDEYKTGTNIGKPYFYAAAIVKSPEKHDGVKIEGQRTSIMEPLCDTPGKYREWVADHYAWILNELKKIGGEECTANIDDDDPGPGLEELCAELKSAGPHIRFETSEGKPSIDPNTKKPRAPMTFENWFGACESPDTDSNDVVEEAQTDAEGNGDDSTSDDTATATGAGDEDLAALAEAAQGGDEDAQTKLGELATEAGVDEEAVNDAADFDAVVALIEEARAAGDAEPEADAEPEPPVKGGNYKFQANDPKTKKPAINPKSKKPVFVDVEVTAVDKKTKTVTLLNNADNKTVYKAVAWDKLESPD